MWFEGGLGACALRVNSSESLQKKTTIKAWAKLRPAVAQCGHLKALIAIWGNNNIQEELDGADRNKAIFQHIANQLQEEALAPMPRQNKELKTKYGEVKDYNGETGRGRKTCKFNRSLTESWDTGQLQFLWLCLTGESSSASTVIPESVVHGSQESEEEKVDGRQICITMEYTFIRLMECRHRHIHPWIAHLCIKRRKPVMMENLEIK